MEISFDAAKRALVLEKRGLDLADAALVFDSAIGTRRDGRKVYGEERYETAGYIAGRCVSMVWTVRGDTRRIITMRHMHDDEHRRWLGAVGRS